MLAYVKLTGQLFRDPDPLAPPLRGVTSTSIMFLMPRCTRPVTG